MAHHQHIQTNGQHANVRLEKISVEQNTNETLKWLRPVNPEQMGTAAESRTEHISQREPELSAPVCTLWNVAHAALIRFLISVVSCCWKVIIRPKYFVFSPLVSITTLTNLNVFAGVRALVAENFRLSWVDPESHFSVLLLNSRTILWSCSFRGCRREHVVSKSHVREAVMIVVTQVDSHTFFLLPTWNVILPMLFAEPC